MRIQIVLGPLILLDLSLLVPTNPSPPNVIVINAGDDDDEDKDNLFGGGKP